MLVLGAVALGLAGCGGAARPPEPRLAHRDATRLEALARQIERDAPADGCAAKSEITALATRVHALVAAGRVPVRLRVPLLRGVESLVADTPACAPPAPSPAAGPASPPIELVHGEGHREHKDHGHGHGHGDGHDRGD